MKRIKSFLTAFSIAPDFQSGATSSIGENFSKHPLRSLHENKIPVNRISAPLNPRRLKAERSRNLAGGA
ncbi:MAG: hypothetical protein HC780_08260 [Leptolyngbyaceae cyanobacterium CSU_1_3]|nr:hypothetical protein [Leptolyngbyaceae cyanobacterium CSU_1_3]